MLNLESAYTLDRDKIHIALTSSSERDNFDLKTSRQETKEIFSIFDENQRVLGDDPRVQKSRRKPVPDNFLMPLQPINERLCDGQKAITPAECLVFECRVLRLEEGQKCELFGYCIWVWQTNGQEMDKEVLAGRIGLVYIV